MAKNNPTERTFTVVTRRPGVRDVEEKVREVCNFPVNAKLRRAIEAAGLTVPIGSSRGSGMIHSISGGRRMARAAARH